MTKTIDQPKQSGNARKAKTAAPRRRKRPQTKKQIALALLERPKGASIAEMRGAMGWQAHCPSNGTANAASSAFPPDLPVWISTSAAHNGPKIGSRIPLTETSGQRDRKIAASAVSAQPLSAANRGNSAETRRFVRQKYRTPTVRRVGGGRSRTRTCDPLIKSHTRADFPNS